MAHIYSAPSLAEVIRQLMLYRLTGVLTIRRATSTHKEEASLAIVQGQPVRVRWGMYEDNVNESILKWINGWGEIHFIFYAKDVQRQLPAPRNAQPGTQQMQHQAQFPPSAAVTRPLPSIQLNNPTARTPVREENRPAHRIREDGIPYTAPLPAIAKQPPMQAQGERTITGIALEKNIPLLTAQARNFPITNLTRYDRTIFLLINDRRTIADLIQLTRRSLPEVYASLHRLKELQLIETLP
ncbi:MAG TPA: hypothetical protein VJ761_20920 [Ktedonobacteraceae bacterium]|nr:hypothetical protein [Ktedonobacteraceae bacterium]